MNSKVTIRKKIYARIAEKIAIADKGILQSGKNSSTWWQGYKTALTEIQDLVSGEVTIIINNQPIKIRQSTISGRELKELDGLLGQEWLVTLLTERGDEQLTDDMVVNVSPGMKFRIFQSATFG